MINQDSWLGLAPNVTMLATKGHPMHTGRPVMNRPATNHSEHEGARKALLDFFLLTETDYFVSNCAYTCFGHHCSNTFAYNIHNHRSPVSATLERFAPHYGCSPTAPAPGLPRALPDSPTPRRPGIGRPAALRRRLGLLRPQHVLISGGGDRGLGGQPGYSSSVPDPGEIKASPMNERRPPRRHRLGPLGPGRAPLAGVNDDGPGGYDVSRAHVR